MSDMTHHQLLKWATNILARAMASQLYGSVSFTIQAGKIVHSEVKTTEKPTLDAN